MQKHVDLLVGQHDTVALRHRKPVDVHAHVREELADFQRFFLRADAHHFMKRGLDLDPVADEIRGQAAWHVVLLEDEDVLEPLILQLKRTGHAGEAAADDHDLIMVFEKFHLTLLRAKPREKARSAAFSPVS